MLLPLIVQNYWHALNTYGERSRGVSKWLLGIFCQECVYDEVSSLDYLLYLLRNTWGYMCKASPLKFGWLEGYIWNSSHFHRQTDSVNIPIVVLFFHVCVSELVVPSYSASHYILRQLCFCFHYCAACYVCKWLDALCPVGRMNSCISTRGLIMGIMQT